MSQDPARRRASMVMPP